MLPFTADQFLDVFERYHEAWPHAAAVWTGLAVLAAAFAASGSQRLGRLPVLILALLWLWAGAVYHIGFFSAINPAAYLFGTLFILQSLLLLMWGSRRGGPAFKFGPDIRGIAGAVLIIYAVIVYQILGSFFGHEHPRAPTFGLPCPVTIFTFGLLLWNRSRTPWYLLIIPVAWSVIGSSAAVLFGIWQDLALPIAGLAVILIMVLRPEHRSFVPSGRLS